MCAEKRMKIYLSLSDHVELINLLKRTLEVPIDSHPPTLQRLIKNFYSLPEGSRLKNMTNFWFAEKEHYIPLNLTVQEVHDPIVLLLNDTICDYFRNAKDGIDQEKCDRFFHLQLRHLLFIETEWINHLKVSGYSHK